MNGGRLVRGANCALLVACACAVARADDDEAAAARLPQRVALLARAQSELERGDAAAALDDFERAAMMLHAADAELGLIHAALQDGQYRRALAFCAHTAGEHADSAEGGVLYAWLLRIGGQAGLASAVLAQVQSQRPDDPLVAAVEDALGSPLPNASGLLLRAPHRMAPWPVMLDAQLPPPATARFAGNAVLVDDGAAAVLPTAMIPAARKARVWVRNGLGQTTSATPERTDPVLGSRGLARLVLRSPLPVGASRQAGGHAPFAGSPGYSLQFGAGDQPAWPTLAQGFLGNLLNDAGLRRLGFAAPPGAPVFDANGALAGITLGSTGAQATWTPASAWASMPAPSPADGSGRSAGQRAGPLPAAPDEIYEAGLRRALQVLVDVEDAPIER